MGSVTQALLLENAKPRILGARERHSYSVGLTWGCTGKTGTAIFVLGS